MLGRLLREPLLHFLALGALIFAVATWRDGEPDDAPRRIVITAGDVQHVADGFARTWQRPPTEAELAGLVAEYVRDEVYHREAMAMGLDRNDAVVRRRLRQKMEFLVEDAVAGAPPSDAELQAYLDAHADDFRLEPTYTLRQVYVSRDRRGDRADADARALLDMLEPDAAIDRLGDPLMVPASFTDAPREEIVRVFGDGFATALAALPVGRWSGPVESGYGLHLVLLQARADGRTATLAEVRDAVARTLTASNRQRMVDAAYAALRTRYDIVIDPAVGDAVDAR